MSTKVAHNVLFRLKRGNGFQYIFIIYFVSDYTDPCNKHLPHTDNKSFVLPGQVRLVSVSNPISLMESLLDATAIGKRYKVYRIYHSLSYILPISLDTHLLKILTVYEVMNLYGVSYMTSIK